MWTYTRSDMLYLRALMSVPPDNYLIDFDELRTEQEKLWDTNFEKGLKVYQELEKKYNWREKNAILAKYDVLVEKTERHYSEPIEQNGFFILFLFFLLLYPQNGKLLRERSGESGRVLPLGRPPLRLHRKARQTGIRVLSRGIHSVFPIQIPISHFYRTT